MTYNHTHASSLNNEADAEQESNDLPSLVSLLLATKNDHHVCQNRRQLNDNAKAHQERGRPPDGAKLPVFATAILICREGFASVFERTASLM
jgi:hypothetical protein